MTKLHKKIFIYSDVIDLNIPPLGHYCMTVEQMVAFLPKKYCEKYLSTQNTKISMMLS